jgi:carbamoyl-phosphate synthase small subunit
MVPCVFGFVVKDYCEFPSNFRCSETLDDFLKRENIPGIYDIDTREITMKIRNVGTMKAVMANVDADVDVVVAGLKAADFLHDQVARVSTNKVFPIPNRGKKVVLMDFGAKLGIVRELSKRGCDLVIVPYDTPASTILSYRPDGVMLSNGPGDPTDVKVAIETIKELIPQTVVFGICLGHQLISLACGAKTYKLKFGHRGANHPVVNLSTGKVEITSQNHGFAVDIDSLKDTRLEMTHQALNDKSCEGVRHKDYPCFAVQYHPEASAGPEDSRYLFDQFIELMEENKNA